MLCTVLDMQIKQICSPQWWVYFNVDTLLQFCIPWQIDASEQLEFSLVCICICKTTTFPSSCFPPLRPSSASVRWHRCITTGRETWRQQLARGKKGPNWGKMKKVSACGGQILRATSSWARKRRQIINVEAVFLSRCCKLYSLCNHCDCR